jgi:hypothetical protein
MRRPGDPDASVGARHHRVPRFYLERFANERMQITTVDRRTRARRTAAIRETAAEKDFYTAINIEGEKDGKSEHLLSHIEGSVGEKRADGVEDPGGGGRRHGHPPGEAWAAPNAEQVRRGGHLSHGFRPSFRCSGKIRRLAPGG